VCLRESRDALLENRCDIALRRGAVRETSAASDEPSSRIDADACCEILGLLNGALCFCADAFLWEARRRLRTKKKPPACGTRSPRRRKRAASSCMRRSQKWGTERGPLDGASPFCRRQTSRRRRRRRRRRARLCLPPRRDRPRRPRRRPRCRARRTAPRALPARPDPRA
jgi:hypothetical protein